MHKLLSSIEKLKKSHVKDLVEARLKEFREIGDSSSSEIFKELCFCILTAHSNAERCIRVQTEIGDGFLTLPEPQLEARLTELGHRYPSARARYIVLARNHADSMKDIIQTFNDENSLREWLATNIKGLGFKEASHFLRNVGFTDLAILDFHIMDILERNNIVQQKRGLTKKRYLEIEKGLKEIAEETDLNLAQLDLYLWYLETGKILK